MNPYSHASAWLGSTLRHTKNWILELSASENDELRSALGFAKSRGASVITMTKADFPLPTLTSKIHALTNTIINETGFTLLKGFDIQRYEAKDAALIYWGIGTHMGKGCAQNAQGDLLGHVTDLGVDIHSNPQARGYQSNQLLPFHNDAQDVVGLLCLHPAKAGGVSRIVSSAAIYNRILETRPELLSVMCQPYCMDRRGETPEGKKPYYTGAFFEWQGDKLFCRYNRTYIESAQRFPEVPRLTDAQVESMNVMDGLCADPDLYLDMPFAPGDMQFINNYTTLHSRTGYEDWPEIERRRYLLRLWLDTGLVPEKPASFMDRFEDMVAWQKSPKAPIFDLSMRRNELAH